MRSSVAALGLAAALTIGGNSIPSAPPDRSAVASAVVEDDNSGGAYLVAALALLGLAGLAGITRRDYLRAHRGNRQRIDQIEREASSVATGDQPVEPTAPH